MKSREFNFVKATRVRRAVVPEGDIRGDVEFQNDINGLLARMDGSNPPLHALEWTPDAEPTVTPIPTAPAMQRVLRVIPGGSARVQAFTDGLGRATAARRA